MQIRLLFLLGIACLYATDSVAQDWEAAKLKRDSVSYGRISGGGDSISVDGKFTDKERTYTVVEQKDKFVRITDGTNTGWVFKSSLSPVANVTPPDRNAAGNTNDPLAGKKCTVIHWDAELKVGSEVVGDLDVGDTVEVEKVNGDWLWLNIRGGCYIRKADVVPYEDAIAYFTKKINSDPSARNYRDRGYVWMERGELDIAIGDFNDAIRKDPTTADYYNGRGIAWAKKGEYDKAIADFSEVIRLDPTGAANHSNRGTIWDLKEEYDDAIEDYNEAIRLKPKDATLYYNRGNAWRGQQEYDKAIEDYNEAIRLVPKNADAYNNRAVAWQEKQEYDKAIEDYNEAIRLNPKHPHAYNNRGNVWKNMQEYDKAIKDYTEAIRLDPKNADAYNNRGIVWENMQEYDKAIKDHNEAIRLNPKHPHAYNNRGHAWQNMQEYDKAIEDYNEAIRLNPKHPYAYNNRCRAWEALGQFAKSLDDQETRLAADPENDTLLNGLAWLLATCPDDKIRDGDRAVTLATKACKLTDWKNDSLVGTLAAAYAASGDFAKAQEFLDKAIELNPDSHKDIRDKMREAFQAKEPFTTDH